MKRIDILQVVVWYCTIGNFVCVFCGIDAKTIHEFMKPEPRIQAELIAKRSSDRSIGQ
jgi:hypothetical protein